MKAAIISVSRERHNTAYVVNNPSTLESDDVGFRFEEGKVYRLLGGGHVFLLSRIVESNSPTSAFLVSSVLSSGSVVTQLIHPGMLVK